MIRHRIRRLVATLGVAVLPVFVAVPLGDCEGTLDVIVEGNVGSPVISLPAPENFDVDGVDFITFGGGPCVDGLGNTARWPDGSGNLVTARQE